MTLLELRSLLRVYDFPDTNLYCFDFNVAMKQQRSAHRDRKTKSRPLTKFIRKDFLFISSKTPPLSKVVLAHSKRITIWNDFRLSSNLPWKEELKHYNRITQTRCQNMERRPHSLHLLGRGGWWIVIEHLRLSIYIRAQGERSNAIRPRARERENEKFQEPSDRSSAKIKAILCKRTRSGASLRNLFRVT